MREHDMKSLRFEFDEMRRKLRDLSDLKAQIEASLDRLPAGGVGPVPRGGGNVDQRRDTLQRSLDEIGREIEDAKRVLDNNREEIERQENVHNGYDRIPVAIGSRRGRGQVEHIRIVRNQRG